MKASFSTFFRHELSADWNVSAPVIQWQFAATNADALALVPRWERVYVFVVEPDLQLALFWYKKSARNSDKEALFNLALLYEKREGVETDLRKAFSLYKCGAKRGNLCAQCNLGVAYLEGPGTEQNLKEGIRWIRKAARRGDASA